MADLSTQPHALNCALLIPGEDRACSCRQLPSANTEEGRKHCLECRRITSAGKYDKDQECTCPKPAVHNHGPEDGPGLNCREYRTKEGVLRGSCLDVEEWDRTSKEYRSKIASPKFADLQPDPNPRTDPDWPRTPGVVQPMLWDQAVRAGLVPPVDSEAPDAQGGEVRTTSATGGHKGVKEARFDLIPSEALAQLAEHYAVGAAKYGDHNWRKGFEWSKSYAALNRHLHAFWAGEWLDQETGKPHLSAVAFHAFTLLTFQREHPEFDDRFKKES